MVYASNVYAVASQNCKAYFESVKLENQHYGARNDCESLARQAIREKYGVTGRDVASRYIDTEEKATEYIGLFKEFLKIYQHYLQE